ncbi:MAG: CRISPR-associated endonuclease Cas3'', partial [Chloroflexota bacterium]
MEYIAHSRNQAGERQNLVAHLQAVSAMARDFATAFGAGDLAAYAGLSHDLGKFSDPFQRYLQACEANPSAKGHGPDHKGAGARHTFEHVPPLALLVQGHHGGLKNRAELSSWLASHGAKPEVAEALNLARRLVPGLMPVPPLSAPSAARDALSSEMFMRLLFSALVDADCLDTEAHFNSQKAALRGSDTTLSTLWQRFERDQNELLAHAGGEVGRVRAEVYQACLEAARWERGLFRLTVPTGGGKTRSGLAFALRHALHHGLRRIIVVVPF